MDRWWNHLDCCLNSTLKLVPLFSTISDTVSSHFKTDVASAIHLDDAGKVGDVVVDSALCIPSPLRCHWQFFQRLTVSSVSCRMQRIKYDDCYLFGSDNATAKMIHGWPCNYALLPHASCQYLAITCSTPTAVWRVRQQGMAEKTEPSTALSSSVDSCDASQWS